MKRIFYILFLCFVSVFVKAQSPFTGLTGYAVKQSLGSDSAIVNVKGALSGRMVIYNFADTTTANTQRIKNYPGALIFTTDSSKLWLRNKYASAWGGLASSSGTTISSIDIFSDSSWVICYSDGSCDTIDVNNQVFVTINTMFGGCNNLLSGGVVTANDPSNTLVFDVTAADYTIGCRPYHTDLDQITLNDGDATFDRFDVVIVDTNEVVSVIEGTPSADPQVPQINHASQLALTTFLVPAGATTADDLGITKTVIYDQNLGIAGGEWDGASTLWTIDRDNLSFPFHLTKSALISGSTVATSEVSWSTTDTMRNGQFDVFKFYIRLTDAWNSDQGIEIAFYNGSTKVSNSVIMMNNSYGFDISVVDAYQTIAIPMANWVLTDSIFFKVSIKPLSVGLNSKAFRLDWIQLQGGINQALGGSSGLYIWNQYSLAQPANYWIAGAAKIEGGITSPNISYYLSERYGLNANSTNVSALSVGAISTASGLGAIAIGTQSIATASGALSIGYGTQATAANATALNGYALHENSIAIQGITTGLNQFVVGREDVPIVDIYFGDGPLSGTPNSITWHATAGQGTNIAGATQTYTAQRGTGNSATTGAYVWQTGDATGSGTTLQSLTNKMELSKVGQLKLNTYGDGTYSGTPTYALAADVDGNIIEWPPGGIGGGILTDADNGLSLRSSTIAVLGQNEAEVGNPAILLSNREIPMGGFYLTLNASAAQAANIFQTKNSSAAVRARITSAASFSNTGGQTGSEIFGDGATVTGTDAVVIGNGATASTGITIGQGANGGVNILLSVSSVDISGFSASVAVGGTITGNNGTSIGASASGGPSGVAVGSSATSSGGGSTALGANSSATAQNAIAINGVSAFTGSIAIQGTTTAGDQLVIGQDGQPIIDGYMGDGVTSSTPNNFTLNATGGSGSDITGANLILAGGKRTGNVTTNGAIEFQTSDAGASGTTLQSLTTKAILSNSIFGIGKFSSFNSTRLEVVDDGLAGANMIRFASSSTAAASNSQILMAATLSGANANASETTTSGFFNNSHTGTGAVNRGIFTQASGGNQNYGVNALAAGASATDNYALYGAATGASATNNYAVVGSASGTGTNNYGGYFGATNGTNNYALVIPGASGRAVFGATTSNANALLELVSTSQAFIVMRMTAAQASAITAADGMLLYVTDTDGTFTSVGVWAREAGAWVKL